MYGRRIARFLLLGFVAGTVVGFCSAGRAPPTAAQESSERSPPVALTTDTTLASVADTTIHSNYPTTNYGNDRALRVEHIFGRPSAELFALLRFDLSSIPANAILDAARLELYLMEASGTATMAIRAHLVSSSWTETGVTWNTQPSASMDLSSEASLGTSPGPYSWNVLNHANAWRTGSNYGLELRGPESGLSTYRGFHSREQGAAVPHLIITYHLPAATATRTPVPTATRTTAPTSTVPGPTRTRTPTPIPTFEAAFSAEIDSWVDQNAPTANHGADTTLEVGRVPHAGQGGNRMALVRFDLSGLPEHLWVPDARLDLYQAQTTGPQQYGIVVEGINGKWNEMGVTWANLPPVLSFGLAPVAVAPHVGWKSWDVTSIVQEWAAGAANGGLLLRGDGLTEALRAFASRHVANGPRLAMHYAVDNTPPTDPTSFTCSHPLNGWGTSHGVTMQWSGETDNLGMHGYSYEWNAAAGTQPDTTVDTQGHSAGASLPDGEWRFHIRTRDLAGNWSNGTHWGPIRIDTVAPGNPTNFTSSHTPNAWSNQNLVAVQWSGESDGAGSGVLGYSYEWNAASAMVPDTTLDTLYPSLYNQALADGVWYLHVRTRDVAGNWASSAAHYGPLWIDTTPPASALNPLDNYQGSTSFEVSWSGTDTGSDIASYNVQVQDDTYNWTEWLVHTTLTKQTFDGVVGHIYGFRCQALDNAGNLEPYVSFAETKTQVGRSITVAVQNEQGANCSGAKVYRNNRYEYTTGASGSVTLANCMAGDTLSALWPVFEQPSVKRPGGWSWRVYLTSVPISPIREPELYTVTNILQTPSVVLTVRKDQTLVGMYLNASVEWMPDAAYMADLATGLDLANDYLYDVTDGQFFWDTIRVQVNAADWNGADMYILTSNNIHPHVNDGPFGIMFGTDRHIYMGRAWSGKSGATGPWANSSGHRTFIHEWGHYGLGLWDEYIDRNGVQTSNAFCATNYWTTPSQERASMMYQQYTATELCSNVNPMHLHRTDTEHDAKTGGETTWASVKRYFSDKSASPPRWSIRTPEDRGAIVPGPAALAVPAWTTRAFLDYVYDACPPIDWMFYYSNSTVGVVGADVWLEHPGGPPYNLDQGKTGSSPAGYIRILGAHNGDKVRVFLGELEGKFKVVCSAPGSASAAAVSPPALVPLDPDPFSPVVSVLPLGGDLLRVQAAITPTLAANPIAYLHQGTATEPITLTLAFSPTLGMYSGQTLLNPSLAPQGFVRLEARSAAGDTAVTYLPFAIESVQADEVFTVVSADGGCEVVLPAGSLPQGTTLAIQRANVEHLTQDDRHLVGQAYEVLASGGGQLSTPATVRICFAGDQMAGTRQRSLQIYRWDAGAGQWVSLGGEVNTLFHSIQVPVDHLSIFAVFGEPGWEVYLPAVRR